MFANMCALLTQGENALEFLTDRVLPEIVDFVIKMTPFGAALPGSVAIQSNPIGQVVPWN